LKAWAYIDSGKVQEECKSNETIYFKVGEHELSFPRANSWQHQIVCSCKHGSLQGISRGALCCHKIAVLAFKTLQFRRKRMNRAYFRAKCRSMTKEELINWIWGVVA